jgi:hypothetical protein
MRQLGASSQNYAPVTFIDQELSQINAALDDWMGATGVQDCDDSAVFGQDSLTPA